MLEVLNTLLWGPGTLTLILGTGAWLTLRTGGFPQRNLGRALTLSLGREARRKGRGGVSPFGSLMTALASTVGTGNIVGVAAALVSGGPGALVWMELAALLGLATKFAECMLAVKYRRVRQDGTRWGGPMAVMETRLGPAGAVWGRFYALFALLMAVSLFGYSWFNYQQTASSQPQMAGMKFMMVYMMPIMMLLWFNSYSSGLCYYYLLSNLFTIGQTLVIRRIVDDEKIHAVMQANAARKSKGKKSKFQQRYEELMRQQEAQQRAKRK